MGARCKPRRVPLGTATTVAAPSSPWPRPAHGGSSLGPPAAMVGSAAAATSLSDGAPVGAGPRPVDEAFGAEHQLFFAGRADLATALLAM